MRRGLAATGAAVVGTLFACTPFASSSSTSPPPEVSPDAGGAPGGGDGGTSEDSSLPKKCLPKHFCDSFARADPAGTDWSLEGFGGRVSLSVDTQVAVPDAHALLAVARSGSSSAAQQLQRPLPTAKKIDLKFSLRRGVTASHNELQVIQISGGTQENDFIFVAMSSDWIGLAEIGGGGPVNGGNTSPPPAFDVWTELTLNVDLAALQATLESGGKRLSTLSLERPHSGPYNLRVGLFALEAPADASVWIDDIDLATE